MILRVTLTPLLERDAKQFNTTPKQPLERVKRRAYKWIANVYQARRVASVESSGLSTPFVRVQLMDTILSTAPSKHATTYPNWFQALDGTVTLPTDLRFAPDITCTVYHHKTNAVFKWSDPSIFMGKAEIECTTATKEFMSQPHWYPLTFEERSYGELNVSFRLVPEEEWLGQRIEKNILKTLYV